MHEISLTWKGTNIFNSANLCTLKKVTKINDRAAGVVALVHAHAHPGRSCDSFNQLAKKFVTCLVASLTRARKRRHLG